MAWTLLKGIDVKASSRAVDKARTALFKELLESGEPTKKQMGVLSVDLWRDFQSIFDKLRGAKKVRY